MLQTQKHASFTLVLLEWSESPALRMACTTRSSLAALFCGHEPKDVVHMQKNVDPFRESRAMVHPGAQELPGPPNENKEKKKENT